MDRGCIDFARLCRMTRCAAFLVVRGRANVKFRRLYSHAIDKQRLHLEARRYTILPVLSVTAFEKTSLLQPRSEAERPEESHPSHNQLNLFDY